MLLAECHGAQAEVQIPGPQVDQAIKKPPQLSPGDPCALAAFLKRPQAELQIGAKEEYKILIDARKLEREVDEEFKLDGLREHYNLSLTQALKIKKLLDKDKQQK